MLLQPLTLTPQAPEPPTASGPAASSTAAYLAGVGAGAVSLAALASLFVLVRYRRQRKLKSLVSGPLRSPSVREVAKDRTTDTSSPPISESPVFLRSNSVTGNQDWAKKLPQARVSRSSLERTAMAPMQPKSSRHLLGAPVRSVQLSERKAQPVVKGDTSFMNPMLAQGPGNRRPTTGR